MKRVKYILQLLFVLLAGKVSAQSEVPAPQNVYARPSMSLNGDWNYFADVQEQGYYDYRMNPIRAGYFQNAKPRRPSDLIEYDFDSSPTMRVPGDWNTQDERLFLYEGTVWFKKDFVVENGQGTMDNGQGRMDNGQLTMDNGQGRMDNGQLTMDNGQGRGDNGRFLLYFGAVNYEAIVYVNGKLAGRHVGGFTPFCFDVTELVHEGKNFVIVKVDNKRHQDNVPTRNFDWWNYGGITRDVLLLRVPETYIEDYSLALDALPQKKDGSNSVITCAVKLNRPVAGESVTITVPELKIRRTFVTDENGCLQVKLNTKKAKLELWSPEHPRRYEVLLERGDERIKDEIGFRIIETRGRQLLLNGKPIFLRGVCAHEETAYTSRRCNSAADADTLLSWAREMGCNFLRLAHYPHNEHAVREAERLGFLLWSEIPVYWTISWQNAETYANAERQLRDMIRRDHNRAAVIIWSLANETPHSEARDAFLGRLATTARSMDSTRLISMAMEVTGASNYVNRLNDNMNKYVDVVSFNQYIGWYRDVNDAPKMTWEIPYDKPVIVSEFGGGAKAGLHGDKGQRWTEEFQENLYRENLAMLEKIEGLAGTCPWVLKDFRSPRRPLPGIQDLFNRKGLVSDQGQRKKAFYVLREWYKKK